MTGAVYKAQCATFKIAREITGDYRGVTHGEAACRPPFSLRIVQGMRSNAQQDFRDQVARATRQRRSIQ